jgi:OmpA-OmpF porin, OOP family
MEEFTMRRFTLCLLLACAPLVAFAGDEVGQWYINPFVGGITDDPGRNTTSTSFDYGVGFGKAFAENWNLELNFNRASPRDKFDHNDTTLSALTLDLLRVWKRDSMFAPYISVGSGWLRTSEVGTNNQDFIAGQIGAGAFIKLWENADSSQSFSLRPDIKARWDRPGASGAFLDYLYTLGFTFSWGPGKVAPPPPPPPVAAPPPPPPPPVAPPPPEPVKQDVVLEGVTFATDSATLVGDSKSVLEKAADGLKQHHRLKVEIQGHTDSTGSAAHNMVLSQHRAESVRDYLVSAGVPAEQLTAKGYGLTQPVASNKTREGRAQNRRVVMHVLDNPGDVTVHKEGQAQ